MHLAFPADFHSFLSNEINLNDAHESYLRNLDNAPEQDVEFEDLLRKEGITLSDRESTIVSMLTDHLQSQFSLELRRMAVFLSASHSRQ